MRTNEQIDRKIKWEWRGLDEKEENSIGAPHFLEAIITEFDAVGHLNLIKIYTSFWQRKRERLSPGGFLSNIMGKKAEKAEKYSSLFNRNNPHHLGNKSSCFFFFFICSQCAIYLTFSDSDVCSRSKKWKKHWVKELWYYQYILQA